MTISLTSEEIARYREQLSDHPVACKALDAIEDCEGDLEDAAIDLALHAGQEPNVSEGWLDSMAKRCRPVLCEPSVREQLDRDEIAGPVKALVEAKLCPPVLVAPVVFYAVKTGVEDFCKGV